MSIVIRRNPIREMASFQSALDRFFDDAWRGAELDERSNMLAVDLHESNDAYILMSNVPGVNSEDIEITLHDGVLNISCDLPKVEPDEGIRVHVNERPFGSYTRSLRLPKAVDAEHVEAAYENGVLTLTMPKTPDAQPRNIPIKTRKVLTEGNGSRAK